MPPDSAIAGLYRQRTTPQTPEEIELGRRLGALVSANLIVELNENGIPAIAGENGEDMDRAAFKHRTQEQVRHQGNFTLETVDLADARQIDAANRPTSFEVTGSTWQRASGDGRHASSLVEVPTDEENLAALAQQTNNPIGAAWLLITQNDTTLIGGDAIDGVKTVNVTKFQPVLFFPGA